VLAHIWDWSLYPARGEVEPIDDADLTQVTMLSALHVGHCAFGQQRRVAQRLLGCSHWLQRNTCRSSNTHPVLGRKPGDRFGHEREVVREHDEVVRIGFDAVGI